MMTWNPRANELFLKARELISPDDRQAFLDEACAGDATLRAEVESLLEAGVRAGSFLEAPARNLVATVDDPSVSEYPGTVIGAYKLLEQIGEGGFGVVFMAEQSQPVRRKVALKVLKPGMDTRQVVARFEAERQALALMDHPNIAHILDGGQTASGRPYFVMELVRGIPIIDFCDQSHLSVRARLELFVSVCQAVQHAHQKGIIHRDLKPSNILVSLHDDKAVVKVIDFGIAKALGQQLTDKTLFTGFAQMIGTPLYMSPEQASLSNADIDTRSDIYSLGVLLYELLTGTTPFDKERLGTVGYDEMRRIIREEEPPRPSTRLSEARDTLPAMAAQRQMEPAKLMRLVCGELDWIVMKALDKDRNRRYESASAFAADIQRYLQDEPVQAGPPSASYRLRKFVRRNKGSVLAASLMSVVLVGGGIGAVFGLVEAQKEREVTSLWRKAEISRAEAVMARDQEQKAKREAEGARKQLATVEYGRTVDLAYHKWENDQVSRARSLLDGTQADLRGWEWHYLHRLCHSCTATYQLGSPMAISDDGRQAVTVPQKDTYVIYDLDGAKEVARFTHTGLLRWTPDGRRYVAGDSHKALRLHDPVSGYTSAPLPLQSDGVNDPHFSLDGRRALGRTSDGLWVKVFDTEAGVEVLSLAKGRNLSLTPVALSPDGTRALINRVPGTASVLLTDSGKELYSLPLTRGWIFKAAFSRSGKLLATSIPDESVVRVWSEPSGAEVLSVPVEPSCLAFDLAGRLVIGTRTGRVVIWDIATKRQVGSVKGHTDAVHLLGFPSDGRLVSGSRDRTIRTWDLAAAQAARVFGAELGATVSISHSRDGTQLVTGLRDRTARVWDAATGQQLLTLSGHPAPTVWSVSFRPDGRQIATACNSQIKIWDAATGRELAAIRPPKAPSGLAAFESVAYSPDGAQLLTCGGATAHIWDASSGRELLTLTGEDAEPLYLKMAVWSPDGSQIAAASSSGAVLVWDVATRARRLTLRGHTRAWSVAFSRDGQRLLSAGWGKAAAKVWDCQTGAELLAIAGHRVGAYAAAFSPDGRRIATAGYDGVLKVWDATSGVELLSLGPFPDQLYCVQLSPDGSQLAVGCLRGGTTVFDASPVNQAFRAREVAPPPQK